MLQGILLEIFRIKIKKTHKTTALARAQGKELIAKFAKSYKIQAKSNGKLTEMVIDSGI